MIEPALHRITQSSVNDEILKVQEQLRQQGVKHHLACWYRADEVVRLRLTDWLSAPSVFSIPQVRIGQPLTITGLTDSAQEPHYSTAVGLLHYGKESHLVGDTGTEKRAPVGRLV